MSDVKLFFAGDVMIDPDATYMTIGEKMKNVIRRCDVVSCNYEAPIKTDNAVEIEKVGPAIYQGENSISLLRNAGFNFFNLSNNHILDYGHTSCENTIRKLEAGASKGAGTFDECYSYKLLDIKGTKIAIVSLAEWGFGILDDSHYKESEIGYAWINHPLVEDLIRRARKDADVVIGQLHAGVEDIYIPWPEWRLTYKKIIDWGCDVIIGHHPHVPQGYETYNGKQIFYSLGNFWFDMKVDHPYWNKGICVEIDIIDKKVSGSQVHWTEKKGAFIDIVNDQEYLNFEAELCDNLREPKYSELVNKYTDELWNDRYHLYYTTSFNSLSRKLGIGYNLKSAAKYVLGRDQVKNNMLLHNLAIESHRFVAERYLKSKWKKSAKLGR